MHVTRTLGTRLRSGKKTKRCKTWGSEEPAYRTVYTHTHSVQKQAPRLHKPRAVSTCAQKLDPEAVNRLIMRSADSSATSLT